MDPMALTSSSVSTGSRMKGPFDSSISNGMPMALSGVRMSLKRMTPSGLNECHGWRLI